MWATFTFAFDERGAFIKETTSGGRRGDTIFVKYRRDGTVAQTESIPEN